MNYEPQKLEDCRMGLQGNAWMTLIKWIEYYQKNKKQQNFLTLSGVSGSGKSEIANMIAKKLNRKIHYIEDTSLENFMDKFNALTNKTNIELLFTSKKHIVIIDNIDTNPLFSKYNFNKILKILEKKLTSPIPVIIITSKTFFSLSKISKISTMIYVNKPDTGDLYTFISKIVKNEKIQMTGSDILTLIKKSNTQSYSYFIKNVKNLKKNNFNINILNDGCFDINIFDAIKMYFYKNDLSKSDINKLFNILPYFFIPFIYQNLIQYIDQVKKGRFKQKIDIITACYKAIYINEDVFYNFYSRNNSEYIMYYIYKNLHKLESKSNKMIDIENANIRSRISLMNYNKKIMNELSIELDIPLSNFHIICDNILHIILTTDDYIDTLKKYKLTVKTIDKLIRLNLKREEYKKLFSKRKRKINKIIKNILLEKV
jgi:hypothetical protein